MAPATANAKPTHTFLLHIIGFSSFIFDGVRKENARYEFITGTGGDRFFGANLICNSQFQEGLE